MVKSSKTQIVKDFFSKHPGKDFTAADVAMVTDLTPKDTSGVIAGLLRSKSFPLAKGPVPGHYRYFTKESVKERANNRVLQLATTNAIAGKKDEFLPCELLGETTEGDKVVRVEGKLYTLTEL